MRTDGGNPSREGRMAPWTPFRELFGFDPFREFLSSGLDYDVSRTERGYEVEIPVPGFKPEQIEVTLKDDVLSVSGKNDKRSFSRSLTIPDDVDPNAIGAHVEDGLLTLTLDRRPEAQPKKIQVLTGH
jgi:HSP20 family molecular chaperone IbpA